MYQTSLIWSAEESCSFTETQEQQSTAFHSKQRDQLNVLIRLVLKSRTENDAEVIEDKTEVGWIKIKNKGDYLPDMLAEAIWVSGSSNFFLK